MSLSSQSSSSERSSGGSGQGNLPPSTRYFAYRHPAGGDGGGFQEIDYAPGGSSQSKRYNFNDGNSRASGKETTVSVQNGALNFRIPCAFSYAYDVPVPPQPESSKKTLSKSSKSSKTSSLVRIPGQVIKENDKKQPIPQLKKTPMPPATRPFVATVKSGQLYKAKKVPHTHAGSKTQAKTSVVWDMHAGIKVPYQAVDYGQELYEQAAQNLAKQLEQQKLAGGKKSSGSNSTDIEDDCYDYSKPGINSSKYTSRALEKAVEDLKNLPEEVEMLLRKDKRFESILTTNATRALNVPRNTRVYKDLIPVDPNPEVRTEAEKFMQAEIKRSIEAARQPSKAKDPEPKLADFQTNSYTRIRPAAVPTPPKPTSGISIEANHDFDTIERENGIEAESNRFE